MERLGYIKGAFYLGMLFVVNPVFSSSLSVPVRIHNYIIPSVFADALQQGMTVPVFIRYDNGTPSGERSRQKIADAIIVVRDGAFWVNQISLSEQPERTELSPQLNKLLGEIKARNFNQESKIYINRDAFLTLDMKSFYLEMTVNKKAMAAAILPRSNLLGESSATQASSILNYTFGSYYNKYQNTDSSSSYLTVDNTSAFREHHLNVNGSAYGLGSSNQNTELYRIMYERDYQGHRLAVGMIDTWNLQSIASMSALNSSRIYGASYGNVSNTLIEDNTLSLIPIVAFLPAAGEVHVSREGRLLSIQNFPMGSYEINTARLPFGIYDVEIQVVVNGKVVNSRIAQINKTFSRQSSLTDNIGWQIFSGMLEYNHTDYRKKRNINYGKKETWLAGLAFNNTKPWLAGVDLKSTFYGFDSNGVTESEVNIAFTDYFNLNQQLLAATEGSIQSTSTANLAIPDGYGSFWSSRKIGYIGDGLPLRNDNYFSVGFSINLHKFSPWLGSFSMSRNRDKYNASTYTNADYHQTLFSNRYATISINMGLQRYHYHESNERQEKYVSINASLPLSSWLSAGFSSENGSTLANATLQKGFDSGPVTSAGASVSKRIKKGESETGNGNGGFAANGYASYDTKYNAGTLSVSHSSDKTTSYNYSSQGSVALTPQSLNFGTGSERSGVVINTHFSEAGTMLAQINGSHYSLSGKSNFISLPPYAEYRIELMNDKTSMDSVDIVNGRHSRVVLYPGNIGVINPEIKQLVTVFGRIQKADGGAFANVEIHNHIGKTKTDATGEFAMDVDKRYPVITLVDERGGICEAVLNLRNARGAIWMGDIRCEPQQKMASRPEGKKRV